MSYDKPVNFSTTGNYGDDPEGEDDVYAVGEFQELCRTGLFIDYDGIGHPVKDKLADYNIDIKPSKLSEIPKDATHIVWYNR